MKNTDILNHFNYGLLIIHKYNSMELLENIIDMQEVFKIPILSVLSLYLMDTNNADGELLPKEEIENVGKLITKYKKNPKGYVGVEKQDIKYILSHAKTKRVDNDTNREIALILADYNNHLYESNPSLNVRIENLKRTLDKLK